MSPNGLWKESEYRSLYFNRLFYVSVHGTVMGGTGYGCAFALSAYSEMADNIVLSCHFISANLNNLGYHSHLCFGFIMLII